MIRYFTFGSDQDRPNLGITDPLHQYVAVEAPKGTDHRAMLIAWLGNNRFAFEYEDEPVVHGMLERYGMHEVARILVVPAIPAGDRP